MRVAITGTGRMAHARARAFSRMSDVGIAAVCSRSSDRANEFIAELGLSEAEPATPEAVLSDASIEGIVITGPNTHHADTTVAALRAGKHVLLEYPPAVTVAGADAIADALTDSEGSLHIGLTHRYGAAFAARGELFTGGSSYEIGSVVSYQRSICSGNPISRWYDDDELSGGMIVSSGFHFIDDALALLGPPAAVPGTGGDPAAHASYRVERNEDGRIDWDVLSVSIEHESGCLSQIVYARGMGKPGIGSRTTAIFTHGYYVADEAGSRILSPDGTFDFDTPEGDAMFDDTRAYVDLAAARREGGSGSNGTFEHARSTLELCAFLSRDIDATRA